MADSSETVLVVSRSFVFPKWYPQGFFSYEEGIAAQLETPQSFDDFLEEFAAYFPRDIVEKDPLTKQLIPYIVVVKEHAGSMLDESINEVFMYQRSKTGGESRLHDKWSIGIGGHVKDSDDAERMSGAILNGAVRELLEELNVVVSATQPNLREQLATPIGFLNDDTTAVGAVHLGLVYKVVVEEADVREDSLISGEWVFPGAIPKSSQMFRDPDNKIINKVPPQFETWSKILLDRKVV